MLYNAVVFSALAIFVVNFNEDHFIVPYYAGLAGFSLLAWLTTYTKLDGGTLTKRIFLLPFRKFPVDRIERIQPHKKNGKWGYGTVVNVFSQSGEKLTLQPNRPRRFLEMLRQQAPQAIYLL